jgi:hypothetical protein
MFCEKIKSEPAGCIPGIKPTSNSNEFYKKGKEDDHCKKAMCVKKAPYKK